MQNPYAAPGTGYFAPFASIAPRDYVPLGWRTTVAGLAIAMNPVFSFLVDVFQLVSGKNGDEDDADALLTLLQGLSGLALILALVAAAVFFGVWLHRAVRNLSGLGRSGMEYTPGGAVVSFYIPFLNLVRPHRALTELWRASDPAPECGERGWTGYGTTSALVTVWWGFWLVSGFLGNISARIDEPKLSGAIGLAGSALMVVAAVTCIQMMRGVVARQEAASARLAIADSVRPQAIAQSFRPAL
jgi:hypothetical protein